MRRWLQKVVVLANSKKAYKKARWLTRVNEERVMSKQFLVARKWLGLSSVYKKERGPRRTFLARLAHLPQSTFSNIRPARRKRSITPTSPRQEDLPAYRLLSVLDLTRLSNSVSEL